MKRDDIVIEVQRRLNLITTANGHPLDVAYVFRNPEEDPSPERMPCVNIFELPDTTLRQQSRTTKDMPIYEKNFSVVLEMWRASAEEGVVSRDILEFLKSVREVIFSDGETLGRRVAKCIEVEVSRVFRPRIGNHIVGIGQVLEFVYMEEFSKM